MQRAAEPGCCCGMFSNLFPKSWAWITEISLRVTQKPPQPPAFTCLTEVSWLRRGCDTLLPWFCWRGLRCPCPPRAAWAQAPQEQGPGAAAGPRRSHPGPVPRPWCCCRSHEPEFWWLVLWQRRQPQVEPGLFLRVIYQVYYQDVKNKKLEMLLLFLIN